MGIDKTTKMFVAQAYYVVLSFPNIWIDWKKKSKALLTELMYFIALIRTRYKNYNDTALHVYDLHDLQTES